MIGSLPVLILNPHSRCNCRCTMCDIWKGTEAQELSLDVLRQQVPSIQRLQTKWVVLSGGEPLMHSNLWEVASVLREQNVRITLLSSGLLLGRYANSVIESVDDVIISLDGPPEIHNAIRGVRNAFATVASGVAQIHALKPAFPISARCTVQRLNFAHLSDTIDAARQLNLDSISFLAVDTDSTAFHRPSGWTPERKEGIRLASEQVRGLEAEIETVIERGECGAFVRESPAKLRRIAHYFRAHIVGVPPGSPVCNAPWKSAVIEADGTVRPCFFHRGIGNLNSNQSLGQILNGPDAIAFRDSLRVEDSPICQRCVCSLHWKDES